MATSKSNINLTQGYDNWRTRPADQRFWTLEEMIDFSRKCKERAGEGVASVSQLGVRSGGDVQIGSDDMFLDVKGEQGEFRLTSHAFNQLTQRIPKFNQEYVRTLPLELATRCINTGLERVENKEVNIFLHERQSNTSLHPQAYTVRSINSDKYKRIWNVDILERIEGLQSKGWVVPPARPVDSSDPRARRATSEDVLKNQGFWGSIHEGDMIAPAGLYASNVDMFTFMVNENNRIDEGDGGFGISRGFFCWNSEVGNDRCFGLMTFLYRGVCGNHIVWDASEVSEVKIKHYGHQAENEAFMRMKVFLTKYANESGSKDEMRVKEAKVKLIAGSKDEVLDVLFGKLKIGVSRGRLGEAYDLVDKETRDIDGDPRTVWGMSNGITRVSQSLPFTSERVEMDKAGSKLMKLLEG